jgi:hypothetical protein
MSPGTAGRTHFERLPMLALGMVTLLAALWAGLQRLGFPLPGAADLAMLHGPLIVSGFLGTVIGLERAVALARAWAYAAPIAAGLGAVGLIVGIPGWPGAALMSVASLVALAGYLALLRRQRALHTLVMAGGALAWLGGNVLWLAGWPVPLVVGLWIGFLLLTIVGERLELNRLLPPSPWTRQSFLIGLGVFVLGMLVTVAAPDPGTRLMGAGMIALTAWLLHFDVAKRTVRQTGLTRFIAVCLLAGYFWLGVGGVLLLVTGHAFAGPVYDAALHAVFVGFVFSMIFGHAPIIFPSILGVVIEYRPRFYAHVAILHVTLAVRVAGDLGGWMALREWGGLLNVLAILLFLANTVSSVRLRRAPGGVPASGPGGA